MFLILFSSLPSQTPRKILIWWNERLSQEFESQLLTLASGDIRWWRRAGKMLIRVTQKWLKPCFLDEQQGKPSQNSRVVSGSIQSKKEQTKEHPIKKGANKGAPNKKRSTPAQDLVPGIWAAASDSNIPFLPFRLNLWLRTLMTGEILLNLYDMGVCLIWLKTL